MYIYIYISISIYPPAPCEVSTRRAARPAARRLELGGAAARAPAEPQRHGGAGGGKGQGRVRPREPLPGLPGAGAGPRECREDPRAFAADTRGDATEGLGTATTRLAPAPPSPGPGRGARPGVGPAGPHLDRVSIHASMSPAKGSPWTPRRRPSISPAAGAPARGGTTGGGPAGGAPPASLAPPATGDPGAHPGPEAPTPGVKLDLLQQQQLGFEHRPYGASDPNGNSWSEKVNVRSTHVIANGQRNRRLNWDTAQEGSLWRASLQVLPKPVPLREHWERPVAYTGGLFRTKRDAKEDACRLLLEEQQRMGRLPNLTVPKPPPGQAASAPGQEVAAQPTPGGGTGQAGPARPRPQTVVPIAKTRRWGGSPEPSRRRRVPRRRRRKPRASGRHRRLPWRHSRTPPARPASSATPLPLPAASQDPGAHRRPQEGGAEAPAGAREVLGRPGRGSPRAAPIRTSLVLSLAASSSPEPPPLPRLSSRGLRGFLRFRLSHPNGN